MDRNPIFTLPPRDDQNGRPNRTVAFVRRGGRRHHAGARASSSGQAARGKGAAAIRAASRGRSSRSSRSSSRTRSSRAPRRARGRSISNRRGPAARMRRASGSGSGSSIRRASDYERALEAYYRSEALAKIDELEPEISKRTAECLEALGKFAALNYELEARTAVAKSDSTGGKDVLAEVGTWKITRADLDMMIEAEIDMQLIAARGKPHARGEARRRSRSFSTSVLKQGERDKWLQRFIAEEMLYRRAREEKLADDPGLPGAHPQPRAQDPRAEAPRPGVREARSRSSPRISRPTTTPTRTSSRRTARSRRSSRSRTRSTARCGCRRRWRSSSRSSASSRIATTSSFTRRSWVGNRDQGERRSR